MKILSILHEGISDIVFHQTSPDTALAILRDNAFKLSSTMSKAGENEHGTKSFYLSTTRSRAGRYHYSHGSKHPLGRFTVILKLDGRKLSSVASGGPVDYWGPDFRKVNPTHNEMEDRVTSNHPEIPNADKYIISVEIFVGDHNEPDDISHRSMTEMRELARA